MHSETNTSGYIRHKRPFDKPSSIRFLFRFLIAGAIVLSPEYGRAYQQDKSMTDMSTMPPTLKSSSGGPCEDPTSMAGMTVMGVSTRAMSNHMCVTPMRSKQPGDEERAKAVVDAVRSSIEKYKDYKKALTDWFVIANPDVDQPQAYFNNDANVRLADMHFDPTKPSSLLYRRTPKQRYKLEGVMFTESSGATEDELNQRVPLSVARWHEHTNFCAAPGDKVKASRTQESKIENGTTDLLLCSGTPCVVTSVNGKLLRFGIDTGNPQSMVDFGLVEDNQWPTQPYMGRDGKQSPTLRTTFVPNMTAGAIKMHRLPVLAVHLQRARTAGGLPRNRWNVGLQRI